MFSIDPYPHDYSQWYFSEKTSRVVAESGIPSDRYHLGKIILQTLKDAPDIMLQLDAATDERETNSSALKRTIQCAESLKNLGLKTGDVVVLMGRNHLDMCIPFYASLYLGLPISSTAESFKHDEYIAYFKTAKPKAVFCQNESVEKIKPVIDELGLDTTIIIFEDENTESRYPVLHFKRFIEDAGNVDVDRFKANDFDTTKVHAILQSTSGTCGMPKLAALTHEELALGQPYIFSGNSEPFFPNIPGLLWAPVQWVSCFSAFLSSPLFKITRIQSSAQLTVDNWYDTVRRYRPVMTLLSPTYATEVLKAPQRENFNFSNFMAISIGGNAVSPTFMDDMQKAMPTAKIINAYGMSELSTIVFFPSGVPRGSCGRRMAHLKYKLMDRDTGEEVTQPHVKGELWLKGPSIFKGYYNNPEGTAASFSEDDWFKTGDIFYRDEQYCFYFVERVKLMFKYRSHHITPMEIENVIRNHPGVMDVAVTGIPDQVCGDLPTALVVIRNGYHVTAQEIKDIVKENLSDPKQLRGGVIFLNSIPMSLNMKPDQKKIKELAMTLEKL